MSEWRSREDYGDGRAIALIDQIVAAFKDKHPGSFAIFDDLMKEAFLHFNDEQYQRLDAAIQGARKY